MRASNTTVLFILTWTLFLLKGFDCQGAPTISVIPTGGKIALGDSVRVQCSLADGNRNASVVWYRCQGDICYKIGIDNVVTLNNGDIGNNRYGLEQVETKDNTKAYKLTVTDAKLEDSATIECRLSSPVLSARAAVSVCSDTSSVFCDCIANKGWASPSCFTTQLNPDYTAAVESSWKTVVGLIIALCVVVAYSVVLILVEKRNFLRQCCTEDQSEEERKLNGKSDSDDSDRGQMDPSDSASDSATCSTSDPSSSGGSDGHGSSQLMPSSQSSARRLIKDEQAEKENRNRNERPEKKKVETSFVVTPEVHYNQGYVRDGNNQPQAEDVHETNIGRQTVYNTDVAPSPLSGHGAIVGQPETPFRYNISNRSSPQPPTRNPRRPDTVSDSTGGAYGDPGQRNTSSAYSSQTLNPYLSYASLDAVGTEI